MSNSSKIEELQEKIKIYTQSLGSFETVKLKFTNKWDQEYTLDAYKKGPKYYLRVSTATSCICEPGVQAWMRKKSYDAQMLIYKTGCAVGTAVHKLAEMDSPDAFEITNQTALACKENEIVMTQVICDHVKYAYQEYLELWAKSKMRLVASEVAFFNDDLNIAGRVDRIVESNGKFGIVDFKTGNVTAGVSIEAKLSAYKYMAERVLESPLIFWVFSLPKDGPGKGYFFPYYHYDLNLDAFLGALAVLKVAHWKQLKTFWEGWDSRIKSVFNLDHFDFCDPDDDVRNEEIAMSLTENQ